MGALNKFVEGTCMGMCPIEEIEIREKERLLHPLEIVPGTEKSKWPKADINRMVKSFSRSAAGKAIDNKSLLRPSSVLLKTVSYLLFDVIDVHFLPWHTIYDFITDRLMAVRQDLVVQNISRPETISILQPIVRFHAYAAYRLAEEHVSKFDPVLNKKHLLECLKKLLQMYDSHEYLITSAQFLTDTKATQNNCLLSNRPAIEALYIIVNLGSDDALIRYLSLSEIYRTGLVQNAFNLSLSFKHGNYVRCCRLMASLPPLLAATASLHLPEIRRKALKVMSTAYQCKNLIFVASDLQRYLLYDSTEQLLEDCKYYGITVVGNDICFNKASFDEIRKGIRPRNEAFVEKKLNKQNVQSLIMCDN